ncbi:cytochrome P450 [Thozetella sp. PMI_491]|nr:cytochrome P450 [Thozetella sp. PMI_491]
MALIANVSELAGTYWLPILVGLVLLRLAYNRYRNGLADIPGPFLASLSDLWLLIHYYRRKGIEEYDMHRKYNSALLRLGPNMISVSDAEAVRIIYGWKPIFQKSRLYISQDVTTEDGTVLQNVSSTRSEDVHRDLRRPIAHTYSLSTLVEYEPLVDSTSIVFLREVSKFAESGQPCPFSLWLQMYAFDVIGEITFSKRFGFLEAGKDLDNMMHHTAKAMDWIGIVGQIPTFDEYFRIKGFGHLVRKFRRTGPIMKFTAKQMRDHQSGVTNSNESRPDFLTRFLKAREKYPDVMTDRRIATYTNTNVSAGSDTTAIALREIVFRLLTHPGSLERFLGEIKAALKSRVESGARERGDFEKPITWNEGTNMPYYQALLKECLRRHPPLGQIIPREVPEGGITLCGRFLPEGTVVGCNAWTVHRDKEVYGADADEFRPERWLEADQEQLRVMENLNFAFGGGPRICLGKNIALLEISKLVPELFRRFEVTIVDPERYTLFPGWLVLQKGLDVTMKKRQDDWWLLDISLNR